MVKSRNRNKSKTNQLSSIFRLVSDGFDLFFPNEVYASSYSGSIIYVHQDCIVVRKDGSGEKQQRRLDIKNPDTALLVLNEELRNEKKVLICAANDACLKIIQPTQSMASKACEDTANACARNNSPFTGTDSLYFWRREENEDTQQSIVVYIMRAEILRLIVIALQNANCEAIGITTSEDYRANKSLCLPGWLREQKSKRNRQKYSTAFSNSISRLDKVYKFALTSFLILLGSLGANLFYSEQKLLLLESAAFNARSELQRLASAGRFSQKFATMHADSIFRMTFLNNIAKQMEDGSWATRILINKDTSEVSGISKSAATTLKSLAKVKRVENVRLLSSVTRDQGTQLERFIIGLDLE